jgi:hypothetical protein
MPVSCQFVGRTLGMVRLRHPTAENLHMLSKRLCCIWLTGGMLTLPLLPEHQIANANSLNATATRRVTGSSTASS